MLVQIDLNKQVVESDNELESDIEDVLPEVADPDAVIEEVTVEGTYFDTLDKAIDMYTNYAEMGGFEVEKSGQRKTKSHNLKKLYVKIRHGLETNVVSKEDDRRMEEKSLEVKVESKKKCQHC
ncbi:hypothetical protein Tco_0717024 [Tanacetum coccineum]